jgi:hypothetical protein
MPATHPSVITPMIPGDTLAFVEFQGAGVSLQNLLVQLGEMPELAAPLQMLDGIGGADELVSWIDDAGIAVSVHDTTPDVALLLVATSESAVTSRVASLKTLLALMGGGLGMEVKNSTINGSAVTTVTITDLGELIPPDAIPGLGEIPAAGSISFSIAARGKVLLVTSGEAAMAALLNTATGSSLAETAPFKQAEARGLSGARTTLYLGVGASLSLARGFMTPDQLATYQSEAAPYLEPFEVFLLQATDDAAGNRSRIVITVNQP